MEEEDFIRDAQIQEVKLPCGILDSNEWSRLVNHQNRDHSEELTKEEVKEIMLNEQCLHPFKRRMVPVDSNAFKWATKLVTGQVIKAKTKHQGVLHFECCNLIWIGPSPRQCKHTVNQKLRKQLDVRAQTEKRYNPNFIPINLMQYRTIGGCPRNLDQRVIEHVAEEKEDDDQMTAASIREFDSDEETDEEPEAGLFLGYPHLTKKTKEN